MAAFDPSAMADDPLAQLRLSFLDECDELLTDLERHLQDMAESSAAAETVNAAFRAVHSVKGGAGAFGFSDMVPLAHTLEAAMDLLRSGKLALEEAPVPLFLRTADALSGCVSAARAGGTAPDASGLVRELEAFLAGGSIAAAPPPAAAPAPAVPPPMAAVPAPPPRRGLVVQLTPHQDLFRRLVEPRHLVASLEPLGESTLACDTAAVPPLSRLDPLACHLAFTLTLETAARSEQVTDILERLLDADEFRFAAGEPAAPSAPAPVAAAAPAPAPAAPPAPIIIRTREQGNGDAPGGRRAPAARSIRVDLDRVDRLMNLVGEIVITQSQLVDRSLSLPPKQAVQLAEGIEALSRQTRELQEQVMAVRAQPVRTVFQRMPRIVRELADQLGKDVRLVMQGEATEVDKTIIEELADPLIHMIRNALDHGLEAPDARRAAGKATEGLLTLAADQRGGRIVITVADDGRGLDRGRLLAKAVDRGVLAPDAQPTPEDIDALIFHAGLSTAEAVTSVSGRGVGMDVVKRNVEALGGRITVESEPGRGCTFSLSLPLTLAVADGMVVRVGGERLVVPITSIMETLQIAHCRPHALPDGREIVRLRGKVAPLYRLGALLGFGSGGNETIVVTAETDRGELIGVAVDDIVGQQQVVVKSLEVSCGAVPGTSAATILGDGLVALILDVDALPGLADLAHRNQRLAGTRTPVVPPAAARAA